MAAYFGNRLFIVYPRSHPLSVLKIISMLRMLHRRLQSGINRQLAEVGGEKARHVARRRIHLRGSRPMVIALHVAWGANGLALL
jgi:hypothetical protein